MFILAFFGFLRCSELTITSGFNPAIHPTISDLAVLGDESISYFIKQTSHSSGSLSPSSPHYGISARSRRSSILRFPLPQQRPLLLEPLPFLPTATAVPAPAGAPLQFPSAAAAPAPAGAPSLSPYCRSSVCSPRSLIHSAPMPQHFCALQCFHARYYVQHPFSPS
ncbi:proline and serine-rich 1-like protein [Labeo rohita]|uniref:Proline and serine-rich 1-like protein n=1 Tax=Labeo rohita TaxID=84645 RepID=A0A498LU73_LABRO|nr:proline and serine-rich 1-like protein [Labeo rohita]